MSNKIIQVLNLRHNQGNWSDPQVGRVYSPDGIAPCLNTMGGGDREPMIIVTNESKEERLRTVKEPKQR